MAFSWRTIRRRFKYMIHIPRNIKLAWRLMLDKRVPAYNKGLFLTITLGYLLSPIDLIPDYIPFVGQLDDLGVILLLLEWFIAKAPAHLVAQYSKK